MSTENNLPFTTDPEAFTHIMDIANRMGYGGCDPVVVWQIVNRAREYEGTYDLMCLWDDATPDEKDMVWCVLVEEVENEKKTNKVNLNKILNEIKEENPHKEETRQKLTLKEAMEAGLIQTGWFWDEDPEKAVHGVLTDIDKQESNYPYEMDITEDRDRVTEGYKNFSETKPESDPLVDITVEQALKLLSHGTTPQCEYLDVDDNWFKGELVGAVRDSGYSFVAAPKNGFINFASRCLVRESILEERGINKG